jgi:hypothetical protein
VVEVQRRRRRPRPLLGPRPTSELILPRSRPPINAAGRWGYSGGTWLLTCVPWYRWSWSLQEAGKPNWTLSLRTPL